MSSYVVTGLTPKAGMDPEKYASDLKAALRETGKEQKASIKKIKVVDDSVQFTVEPTSVAGKVIEAVTSGLGLDVKPAPAPLSAFAEKYGFGPKKG